MAKNRRTILVAFILVACMLIGVGYAAINTELYAKGSVSLSAVAAKEEVDADVYFTNVESVNCNSNIDATDSDVIIIRITDTNSTMAVAGDTAVITATVKNDALVPVEIVPSFHNGEDYLEGIKFSTDAISYTCDAGSTVDIVITATLTATVASDLVIGSTTDSKVFVTFTATAD